MRPHGRAKVSTKNPQAFGICDRCGLLYNHTDLRWQFDWAGATIINKRILVCRICEDTPQEQLRAIVLPADPVPIMNPRTEAYADAETDFMSTNPGAIDPTTGLPVPSTTDITTEDGTMITYQPIGAPVGLDQNAVMPLYGNVQYGVPLSLISVSSNGTTIISVTTSTAHGLSDNSQVSVEGLSNVAANGFYSVKTTGAMSFQYEIAQPIATSGLLQSSTRIITAIVGLPYDYTQIPQTGI